MPRESAQRFGGNWTQQKLQILEGYLSAYTTALKDKPSADKPFRKAYIDAFAGTGYLEVKQSVDDPAPWQSSIFPDIEGAEPQKLLDGSARLALKTEPRFDKYIFIERSVKRCALLRNLKAEFPALAEDIDIRQNDANAEIQKICAMDWRSHRAVLFLDPFGMQVEWKTIEAIAKTKAIDLWLLFPLGIGVNRLLKKSGEIPPQWRHRLDLLLGGADWFEEFYSFRSEPTMFGTQQEKVVKATMATIGKYFVDRLRTVFAGVVDAPAVLRNSANNPLYLLCFAVGSETGKPTALKIAEHLLKKVR